MNWDSVGDEFAGVFAPYLPYLLLPHASPSPLPTPLSILSLVLRFWFVCVFLWRAEVPFVSSSAPSCFLRQGLSLSLNSLIQPG